MQREVFVKIGLPAGIAATLANRAANDRAEPAILKFCHAAFMNRTLRPIEPIVQQLQPDLQQVHTYVEHDDAIDLGKYINFLLDNRWLIAGIALCITLLGIAYTFIATPIYEANILVQVEDSSGSNPSSTSGTNKNIQGDLSGAFDIRTVTASEIEVLRSRTVVSRAVDNAQLYIHVRPKYFPVIGEWFARHNNKTLSEPGLFGRGGYVWGAERAEIPVFNVPLELEGKRFVLTAEGDDTFRLTLDEPVVDIWARVGETVRATSPSGVIELRVSQLAAKPGAQFSVTRNALLPTVEGLQKALGIAERGKQSGIIGVTLEGPDPKLASQVLNEIGREYIQQNVFRKSEKAQKALVFLDKQLPELKEELDRSENRYNAFRNKNATIDLAEESKSLLQRSVMVQTKLGELNQRKAELLARYESEHPAVEAIDRQVRELNRQLGTVNQRIKALPDIEQQAVRLSRDVKVNTELYTTLLSTAQELRLVTSSALGNVRLLDTAATPVKPVKPKRLMVITVAALIGLALGVIAAYIRKTLHGGISDPQDIGQSLGLTVSATIPHSKSQEHLYLQMQNKAKTISVLAYNEPTDGAVESLRGFRASLQFAMRNAQNNVVMITSPTAGVGKSFVSVNLSAVLAASGRKVLLIDGDLRKGYLHRYFGLDRGQGFSDALAGAVSLDRVIHRNVVENIDFISNGNPPPKSVELLAHDAFSRLLQQASPHYDFVLMDVAPVLSVADALIVAPYAGAVFSIVRRGVSTVGEIEEAVTRLNQAGVSVTGTLFNDLKPRGRYGYGYEQYRYAD